MFEFTLLKSLFFELDKQKMDGVTEKKEGTSTFHRIEVSYANVPEITVLTVEERILPMVDRYYIYINDEERPTDLKEENVQQAVYEFYKDKFPQYLKEDLPEILGDVNILECFNTFNMPDYRPKHAFPGLVTLEDIKNGNVPVDDRVAAFPGLELIKKRDDDEPTVASYEGYTAFEGSEEEAREQAQSKIEEMKKQFASQLEGFNL